jgi:DNA-binding SARP family transcriptional activator
VSGLGALIRNRRQAAGLTQLQLAQTAAVSVGMLRDLEQDRTSRPRRASLQRVCAALDLGSGQPGEEAEPGNGAVKLTVLGPLGARRGDLPVQLGGARARALLGLLAVAPNAVLHRDTIIETLWAADPPSSAAKMVQAYVARLRRQLDPGCPPGDGDGFLISAGAHYRLRASAEQLDLIAFGQLCARAQAARRSGDAAAACELYAEALGLWRGEPLADLDLLSGHPAVVSLDRRRAAVVNDFAETAIGAGLPDRALPHLESLVERDPLDERAHAW